MFKRSTWLEKYGLVPKIFLAILLFVSLGGFDFMLFIKDVSVSNNRLYSHNAKLDIWNRPPAPYEEEELNDWTQRHQSAEAEIKQLLILAEAKGENYSLYDYFHDYDQLMILEDKYNFCLTSPAMFSPLQPFVRLRDQKASWNRPEISSTQLQYIESIQRKISLRSGEFPSKSSDAELYASLINLAFWLIKAYLMFMVFWLLIYLIRFQERKTTQKKIKRHIHNTDRFYDDFKKLPGNLSLRDELLLCPWRFISRIVFWPLFCWKYPFYETTAEMFRYNRLKAEFLRYKPVGYQLTPREDAILRSQAKRRIKDFRKAIRSIQEFQIYPTVVRKSLATAYISLALGVILQPVIVFAAQYSDKINDHFCGQTQLVQQEDSQEYIDTGPDPPSQDDQQFDSPPVLPSWFSWLWPVGLIVWLRDNQAIKLKELIYCIDHVPIQLFWAARCQ